MNESSLHKECDVIIILIQRSTKICVFGTVRVKVLPVEASTPPWATLWMVSTASLGIQRHDIAINDFTTRFSVMLVFESKLLGQIMWHDDGA